MSLLNSATLTGRIRELEAVYDVPGASVAIVHRGDTVEAAAGVANALTGAPVTPDTRFQIGSISKVFTATLVMRALEEGRIDLDTPVHQYIPGLRFADDEATETITTRHLMTHTSGLGGDFYEDSGRGDDAIARYVEAGKEIVSEFRPGEMFSYCNAGWVVLGRMLELLYDKTFERVMGEMLLDPAGLGDMVLRAEDAILGPVAVGHVVDPKTKKPAVAPRWMLPWAMAPAGSIINSSARTLAAFGTKHLRADPGLGLSTATIAKMRDQHVTLPDRWTINAYGWALGWILFDWNGTQAFGHDGGTVGQSSLLRVLPEHDLVVSMLTNGGRGLELMQQLLADVVDEACDVPMPKPLEMRDAPVDVERFVGKYWRQDISMEIVEENGDLAVHATPTGRLAKIGPPVNAVLRAGDGDTLMLVSGPAAVPMTFVDTDGDGRADVAFSLFRAHHRID